jgi:hypothetical protein
VERKYSPKPFHFHVLPVVISEFNSVFLFEPAAPFFIGNKEIGVDPAS